MQVTVLEPCRVVIQCQVLGFEAGQVVRGDVAAYLLRTGAPVRRDGDPAPEPVTEPTAAGDATAEEGDPATEAPADLDIDAKIADVLAWVGDDPDRAAQAIEAERAKGDKARSRLLGQLAEITG